MAIEKPGKQRYPMTDIFMAIGIIGAMVGAMLFFGRVPALRPAHMIDKRAPDIEFELPSGKKTALSRQKGRVILINFWASWCGPCMEEMPSLRMLENHFSSKGFALFAFNIEETKESVRGVIPSELFPENLIFEFNKSHMRPYDVRSIPLSVLIDRYGLIREVFAGPRNWMDTGIIKEIEALLQ
jgi:thiol-disulfide isomerase/thioredoxin